MKYRIERSPDGDWIITDVWKRGHAILADSLLNKGTAFSEYERDVFGLRGLLPARVTTQEEQVPRAYESYSRSESDLERHFFLSRLQESNETLFKGAKKLNRAFEATVAASMSVLRLPLPGLEFNRGLQGRQFMIDLFRQLRGEARDW